MPDEKPTTDTITLPVGGAIAGIPGSHHAPGTYLVDWLKREITPVVQVVEEEVARVKKKVAPVEDAPSTSEQTE